MQTDKISQIKDKLFEWKNNLESASEDNIITEKNSDDYDAALQDNDLYILRKQKEYKKKILNEIKYALLKIECGIYGICEESGDEIEEKRLEANPLARYSLEVQRALEKNHDN